MLTCTQDDTNITFQKKTGYIYVYENEFQGPRRFWTSGVKVTVHAYLPHHGEICSVQLHEFLTLTLDEDQQSAWSSSWFTLGKPTPITTGKETGWTQNHFGHSGGDKNLWPSELKPRFIGHPAQTIKWATPSTSPYAVKDITTKLMLRSTLFSNTADLYYINNSAGKSSLVGKLVCVPYFCTDTVATSHDRFTISFIGNSG